MYDGADVERSLLELSEHTGALRALGKYEISILDLLTGLLMERIRVTRKSVWDPL